MGLSWWPFGGYKVSPENEPLHPYYPLGVYIPAYAPNEAPVYVLLAALVGMLGFAVLGASAVALKTNPKLTRSNLAVLCWFVMNGCLHCFFEGYFVLNHDTVASSQNLFAQLWKEYALSDSRYLTSDFFMLSVESITAFVWGPLCFANAVSIVRGSPSRHVLRIIVCMAHIYGVTLYYSTSLCQEYLTGLSHSRPEFLYFWVYYVGFNLPWAIIPSILIYNSTQTIMKAVRALDKVDSTLKTHRYKQDGKRATESRKTK